MQISIHHRTRRLRIKNKNILGPAQELELLKYYYKDLLRTLRKNLKPTSDVIIVFPMFKYLYTYEDNTLSLFTPSKRYVITDLTIDYTVAFKHLKISRNP